METTTVTATAILAGLVAGLASGVSETAKVAVKDAYDALKAQIKTTLGAKNDLTEAIKRAEDKPTSTARKSEVHEAATEIKADEKQEILRLAQALLEILKNQSDGEQHIQNAQGSYIAQADRGSTASVTINGEKK